MNVLELTKLLKKHVTVRDDKSLAYYTGGEYCHIIPTVEDIVNIEKDLNVVIRDLMENGKASLSTEPGILFSKTGKESLLVDYSKDAVERTYTTLLAEIADLKYGTERGFLFTTDYEGNLRSQTTAAILEKIKHDRTVNNSLDEGR